MSNSQIYLDITQTVARAKSGIETVATSIARALPPENLLVWEGGTFRHAAKSELQKVSVTKVMNSKQSMNSNEVRLPTGSTILLPEIISDSRQILWLRGKIDSKAIRIVCMVYDLLPLSNPDLFPDFVLEKFLSFMHFARKCDHVIFCSADTKASFELWDKFARSSGFREFGKGPRLSTVDLPSVHETGKCQKTVNAASTKAVRVLQVGNFDPRKNLEFTLNVCRGIVATGRQVKLDLVGGNSWKMDTFFHHLKELKSRNLVVRVQHNLPDDALEKLWLTADLSLYFSHAEGFGLPISESLFRGIPVVCSNNLPASKINKSPHLWGVEPGKLDLAVKKSLIALHHGKCVEVNARVRGKFLLETSWFDYGERVLKLAKSENK